MASICVLGSLKTRTEGVSEEDIRTFVTYLGEQIVKRDHRLYTGCMNDLDALIAQSASTWLESSAPSSSADHIFNYVVEGGTPVQTEHGKLFGSQQKNWVEPQRRVHVPEQIWNADIVVLVGGGTGTRMGADWANIISKPLLPVTAFGGTAAEIYREEIKVFDTKYGKNLEGEYENLNQVRPDWRKLASDVVALGERLTSSQDVFVIRSISKDPKLIDILDSFYSVCCKDNTYQRCEPVSELTADQEILEEIEERIQKAAFVIADLTEPKPNVYYELGYARGLGKRIIVTAHEDTDLEFDVQGDSTLLWEGQTDLKKQLEEKMQNMGLSRPANS